MFPNMLTTEYANALHAARLEDHAATRAARRSRAERSASTHGRTALRTGVTRLLARSPFAKRGPASATR